MFESLPFALPLISLSALSLLREEERAIAVAAVVLFARGKTGDGKGEELEEEDVDEETMAFAKRKPPRSFVEADADRNADEEE